MGRGRTLVVSAVAVLGLVAAGCTGPTPDPSGAASTPATAVSATSVPGGAATVVPTEGPAPGTTAPPRPLVLSVGEPAQSLGLVEPVAGSLRKVSRDCGFTVPVASMASLWVFCDTIWAGSAGRTLSSTASVSAAGAAMVLYDALDPARSPYPLLPLTPADQADNDAKARVAKATGAPHDRVALWPTGAVALDERQALVSYRRVREVGDDVTILGTGLALLPIRGAVVPSPAPLTVVRTGTTMVDDPWPAVAGTSYGPGLTTDGTWVYTFACTAIDGCRVARAGVAALAAGVWTTWQYGGPDATWVDDVARAVPVVMLGGPQSPVPGSRQLSIAEVDGVGWVMAYSPEPVFTDHLVLRVADQPTGPWSPAVSVPTPDCHVGLAGGCYAYALHPELSTPGHLVYSFYQRPAVTGTGIGGRMQLATVAVTR